MSNTILDELHAAREKLLADAGGDLHRYVEEARQRALASGRALVHSAVDPFVKPEEAQSTQELCPASSCAS